MSSQYSKAGVNLKLARNVKANLPALLRRATRPEVLGRIGAFGGLFKARFPACREPVLVASMDGVGTKLRVAVEMGRHDTVGQDLVNHCCDDIAVMGADPLFFLDYMGTGKLEKEVFDGVIQGLAKACAEAGMALLGGETAQMPGIYAAGDYDLVGTIVGVVDRRKIIDGSKIETGDEVVGLASTGLHTNGYSLAREILFKQAGFKMTSRPSELEGESVGEALLRVHRNYHPLLASLRRKKVVLHGAAHITGGGFIENIERVLPRNALLRIDRSSWNVPPIFELIRRKGRVSEAEMYRVFNMGIGMVLVVPRASVERVRDEASAFGIESCLIGRVARGRREVMLS
ncbi:MAG: phosphoribosylformylglycinamidine cyclo-ligase [Verrucomicrobiae bacterium]|nr:phosphoribosylformylglycinamidine cyclo-ligase [Verrucomicrobiae bacterium]